MTIVNTVRKSYELKGVGAPEYYLGGDHLWRDYIRGGEDNIKELFKAHKGTKKTSKMTTLKYRIEIPNKPNHEYTYDKVHNDKEWDKLIGKEINFINW